MRLRRRSSAPPPLEVAAGERVLAWATGENGAVGGSRQALYLPRRVPWERVASAEWDEESSLLRVTELAPWGEPQPVHERRLADAGLLLQLVRERVTASIVLQRHVVVPGLGGARVLARRPPSGTGALAFFVEYDEGLDPTDPRVGAVVDAALATAREDVGA
ncbi:hypothetical protein [Nocardioides sp. YIM 152588]|uniref:hypothetical protein n=1 Tax=Nocardioides sp. YIM 152588 TaxID=3158259 RepID=UPI0032E4ED58